MMWNKSAGKNYSFITAGGSNFYGSQYILNTSTPEGVIEQMRNLEAASGLKVTGFINTNLIRETTAACLADGDAILKEVTKRTGVPVKYVSYVEELLTEKVPEGLAGELFPMKFYMRKSWM